MRARPYGDKRSKEEAQLALQACSSRVVRDGSTKEAVFELRLEGPLRCTKIKGKVVVSVPRGEQQEQRHRGRGGFPCTGCVREEHL